jgi:hypothetical protein
LQARIADFRRTHAYVESVDHIDVETGKLSDLMQQLTILQGCPRRAAGSNSPAGPCSFRKWRTTPSSPAQRHRRSARVAEASVDLGFNLN